jgi:uncharacterized RDD family membrane protein YckC
MKSNAQREAYNDATDMQQDLYAPELRGTGTDGGSVLKQLAAERLAAHRQRRASVDSRQTQQDAAAKSSTITPAAQKVRDAVAARYQQTPSFREYLAAEAEDAVQKTRAEAELATRAAKAVADVQMQLMAELEQWPEESSPVLAVETGAKVVETVAEDEPFAWMSGVVTTPAPKPAEFELQGSELRVRHYEALPQSAPPPAKDIPEWVAEAAQAYRAEELQDLNEEIEFRLAPEFQEHLLEPLTIQANIIEFPRQLVAARKARPRIAEGPLRTENEAAAERPEEFQMRIFEVDAEQISVTPPVQEEAVQHEAPEWQSLVLGRSEAPVLPQEAVAGRTESQTLVHRETRAKVELRVASAELRLMSAIVDAVCVCGAAVVFVTAVAMMTDASVKSVPLLWLSTFGAALLVVLFVMYQGLFFSLGESTPGMRYANIVFRSLQDGEPSKSAMRKRVGANVLAAVPLGIGLMWSLVDGESLGWNDRMSGLYLREF